jgi:DNA polymerase-1
VIPAAIRAALNRFDGIWAVDFEFTAPDGERPDPICCVAKELTTGREVRLWDAELRRPGAAPFASNALLVAYYASAELSCCLALGWPMPAHVLDLHAEFRVFANGRDGGLGIRGAGLLAALSHFGLSHLDPEVKANWRERILQGRPFSPSDRAGILDYCASDVIALERLLPPLAARLQDRPHWLEHALLRGRYMRAVAAMEHTGVPVDVALLRRLVHSWECIKAGLIDELRAEYPIFDGTTLKHDRFESWLASHDIPWPRTETGRVSLSDDTFRVMERAYPIVAPIKELRVNLGQLRLTDLAVGRDGRNRCLLSPFRARSGRNAPSASKFIFAPSVWLRSLIRPEPGRAIAYVDFTSQEIGVAAALSGDEAMLRAYQSGDPYLSFAKDAGLAPPNATKETHKGVRDRCKALVLGTLYGMREVTLAGNLNVSVAEARALLAAHRRTYKKFWEWSRAVTDTAMLQGHVDTCFGWRLHVTGDTRPTSLLNHPMQSHGAEMLRLACSFLVEAGIRLCAPIHDAVLIEGDADEIHEVVVHTRQLMARASRIVLGGLEVGSDAEIVRYPARYQDERGSHMWRRVMALLEKVEAAEGVAQCG